MVDPVAKAREEIDAQLQSAGWIVCDQNISEAKKFGHTLKGDEVQSDKSTIGLPDEAAEIAPEHVDQGRTFLAPTNYMPDSSNECLWSALEAL